MARALAVSRLADAGRPEEQERGQRPVGVVEPRLGDADHVGRRLDGLVLADDLRPGALENLVPVEPGPAVEEGERQPALGLELLEDTVACDVDNGSNGSGFTVLAVESRPPVGVGLDRQAREHAGRLAGERRPCRSYRRCRSMTAGSTSRSNPQRCLPSKLPLYADQDAQRVGVGRLADRQDVEQVGEAAVALLQDAQRLRA